MVEFKKSYKLNSGLEEYTANARTYDSSTGYGNDTSLEIIVIDSSGRQLEPLLYDMRYSGIWTPEEMDDFVRDELKSKLNAKF